MQIKTTPWGLIQNQSGQFSLNIAVETPIDLSIERALTLRLEYIDQFLDRALQDFSARPVVECLPALEGPINRRSVGFALRIIPKNTMKSMKWSVRRFRSDGHALGAAKALVVANARAHDAVYDALRQHLKPQLLSAFQSAVESGRCLAANVVPTKKVWKEWVNKTHASLIKDVVTAPYEALVELPECARSADLAHGILGEAIVVSRNAKIPKPDFSASNAAPVSDKVTTILTEPLPKAADAQSAMQERLTQMFREDTHKASDAAPDSRTLQQQMDRELRERYGEAWERMDSKARSTCWDSANTYRAGRLQATVPNPYRLEATA